MSSQSKNRYIYAERPAAVIGPFRSDIVTGSRAKLDAYIRMGALFLLQTTRFFAILQFMSSFFFLFY